MLRGRWQATFRLSFPFTDPATSEISTLSLHDALPIWAIAAITPVFEPIAIYQFNPHMHLRGHDMKYIAVYPDGKEETLLDRKSTRLNSSHTVISYAVFCLKKKKVTTALLQLAKSVLNG